jgi:hypothetical protein
MSDQSGGPGWWLASDGKWYPPQPSQVPPDPTPESMPARVWHRYRAWPLWVQIIVGLLILGAVSAPFTSRDADPQNVSSSDEQAEETTTTHRRPTPSSTTTRPPTTTTTIDPNILLTAHHEGVLQACAEAAAAPLAQTLDEAVDGSLHFYSHDWDEVSDRAAFGEAVKACAAPARDDRLNNECGRDAPVELMNRDPDQFRDQCFTLVFLIVQFDQGTGPCAFRAYFDNVQREYNFEYLGENALVTFDEPCPQLDPIGNDDVVRVRVISLGGIDYDTTIGGSTSAAAFRAAGGAELLQNN